jgi:hypothetical protein
MSKIVEIAKNDDDSIDPWLYRFNADVLDGLEQGRLAH